MDTILNEDQALQAHIGAGLGSLDGIDNEAIDITIDIKQLEDFINNEASLLEDAVPPPMPFADIPQGVDLGLKQESPRLSATAAAPPPIQTTLSSFQHNAPLAVNPPLRLNEPHQKNAPQFCHTQLPDSPPDSGSEPYSPPDGNTDPATYNVKASIVGGMTTLPQHAMYPPMSQPPTHPHSSHQSLSPAHTQQHSPPTHSPPTHTQAGQMASPQVYNGGGYAEPPKLNHLPTTSSSVAPPSLSQLNPQMLPAQYNNHVNSMNNVTMNKKRKFSDSPNNTVTPGVMCGMGMNPSVIKQEPVLPPDCTEDHDPYDAYDLAMDPSMFMGDGAYQVIKWNHYTPNKWCPLLDDQGKELPQVTYRVDADKGFNFSVPDDSFVCQKKNHFQVTVHMGMQRPPLYVRDENNSVKHVDSFYLHFNGIKMESASQTIKVEQSQSDRSKKPFNPIKVDLIPEQVTKITVGRLHFSETTTNNMRKKGKPNPDQRYFLLVVGLYAHSGEERHLVAAQVSERIIVRASNPGQFDNDVDAPWNKGHTPDSVFHAGRVGINTDRPDEALTVHGNIKMTGHLVQPSDKRVKEGVQELDSGEQLKNIAQIKVYKYKYKGDFAECAGLSEDELDDTGVIAQELSAVLPDAVKGTGDVILPDGNRIENFQVVNKDRLYMESVGAVRELCKVTNKLEDRMNELEFVSKRLNKHKRDSLKSTTSTKSTCSTTSRCNSLPPAKKSQSSSPQYHRRHYDRSRSSTPPAEENQWCSNKFIQITIIILFLVMAFCLVSITVLYIMERSQNTHPPSTQQSSPPTTVEQSNTQNSSSPPTTVEQSNTRNSSSKPDKTSTMQPGNVTWNSTDDDLDGFNMSTVNKDAPPLTSPRCLRTECERVCCREPPANDPGQFDDIYDDDELPPGGFPSDEMKDGEGEGTQKQSGARGGDYTSSNQDGPQGDVPPETRAHGFAGPPAPEASRSSTGSQDRPESERARASNDSDGSPDEDQPETGKRGSLAAAAAMRAVSSTTMLMQTLKNKPADNEVDTKNQTTQSGRSADQPASKERINYSIAKAPDAEDRPDDAAAPYLVAVPDNRDREKRAAAPSVDYRGVPLLIIQTNESLSQEYCANENCRQQTGGNYEYYVPISDTFLLAHVTFKFMLPDRMFMYRCKEREEMDCPNTYNNNMHVVMPGEDSYTWDLPVGYYMRSEYTFRVAREDNYNLEVDICALPTSQAGIQFAQYKLLFERIVCSPSY